MGVDQSVTIKYLNQLNESCLDKEAWDSFFKFSTNVFKIIHSKIAPQLDPFDWAGARKDICPV